MDFFGISVDQALAYYRKNHKQKLSQINGESLLKQVEDVLNTYNASLVQQLDRILLNQMNSNVKINNESYLRSKELDMSTRSPKERLNVKLMCSKQNIINFPPEIISNILQYTGANDRFSVAQSCRLMADIIHDIVGYKNVYLKRFADVLKIRQYKGIMNNTVVQMDAMKGHTIFSLLSGCCKLKTSESIVNDSDLLEIASANQVSFIDITKCYYVTDKGIKALSGVHTIKLGGCKVTDEGIKALKGVYDINLAYTEVTDEGVKELKGVHDINLACTRVTDEGLKYLKGVNTINLAYTRVTDKGIKALKGVYGINLTCTRVTDEGVKELKGAHTISLRNCMKITDEGIKPLKGVYSIDLTSTKVTDKGLLALKGVHTITLSCCKVTREAIKLLEAVEVIE